MTNRKHPVATMACLPILLVGLSACGGGESKNPVVVSTPTPPPPPVTRVIDQESFALEALTLGTEVFTTTTTGTLGITVDWTFASSDVDIFLVRGNDPCTLEMFLGGTCPFLATEESLTMKPEKLTVPNVTAGTYTLYIANFSEDDESLACQITLTTASGAVGGSESASAGRGHRPLKARIVRILEPR